MINDNERARLFNRPGDCFNHPSMKVFQIALPSLFAVLKACSLCSIFIDLKILPLIVAFHIFVNTIYFYCSRRIYSSL